MAVGDETGILKGNLAMQCAGCQKDIEVSEGVTEQCARIDRGTFNTMEDPGNLVQDYIKFRIYICKKCFLEDPDLCRFFNKIGCRVR